MSLAAGMNFKLMGQVGWSISLDCARLCACAGSSATAQRQAYLPSLSPGSTVSQASFNGYAASTPGQQQPASWGMLPMHSSAQSIWSSTPADRCPAPSLPFTDAAHHTTSCPDHSLLLIL